ncbi:hypothetical protein QBZ16_003948 [Prototheca wickerhamii]|uniref:AAA+ ATPase domain-containing protein n=1 Tax=Prototheca wickerhamii TaxID=3111 RepID=A0AAD9IK12_PROWI|nr:hypothetical protein QBZ16_003948 [Prototheca wickerhamii]
MRHGRKRLKASHELESALDSGLLQLERPDDGVPGAQSASTPTGSAEPTGAVDTVAAPEALPGTPKRDVQPSWDAFITSVGPCPSQSVRASILKSPTPPRRSMLDATPRLGRVVRMLIPPVDLLEVEMETRRALHAEAQLASERQATAAEAGRGVADDAALPETGRAAAEPRPTAAAVEAAPTTATAEQVSETGLERAQSAQSSIAFAERTASGADEAGPSASEWWDPLDRLKAGQARAVLHTSHQPLSLQSARGEPSLLCREAQIQRLRAWLLPRLTSGSSASTSYGGSCYVSGPPGTGKTLTVCGLLRSLHADLRANQGTSDAPVLACINCMRLSSGRQVAGRALEALAMRAGEEDPIVEPVGAGASRSDEEALSQLRSLLLPPRAQRRLILVLDELDGLLDGSDRGEALVEDLFSIAHAPGSQLVILGIANSIDLVQRLLLPGGPFHRRNLRPEHVTFPAYDAAALCQLLEQRVATLPGPVFEPRCLELCARKVSNGSGDMRLALEAAAAALDLAVEAAERQQDERLASGQEATASRPSRVSLRDMASALGALTGGVGAASAASRAQLLLVALTRRESTGSTAACLASSSGGSSACSLATGALSRQDSGWSAGSRRASLGGPAPKPGTLGALGETHGRLARQVGIGAYSPAELAAAVEVLADQGLLTLGPRRGAELQRRITLKIAEQDVAQALQGVPVIGALVEAPTSA